MIVGGVKIAGRKLVCWGLGLLLSSQALLVSAQAAEASLRVAFVYNFLKFIEWPAQTNVPVAENSAFSLCAVNAQGVTRDALGQLANKSHQSRPIKITYIDLATELPDQISRCQLLYVPTSGADFQLPQSFPSGVLLVVDEAHPDDGRVAISLLRTADSRIEFVMNEAAIERAGVKVSSQLRKLAKKPKHQNSNTDGGRQ